MPRSLIVARITPGTEEEVARVFAESDRTELPQLAGVTHRSLWTLGDVYVHLLDTEDGGQETVERIRAHPEFRRVSAELEPHISPYLSTWRGPADAQARRIYSYSPEHSGMWR